MRCALRVVCCLIVVCCVVSVVCCVHRSSLFFVSAVCKWLFAVCCPWVVVCDWLFVHCCLFFVDCLLPGDVDCMLLVG